MAAARTWAVVGVGKSNGVYQVLEPGDQSVADMGVHEPSRAFQLLGGDVGAVAE